jgi:hypothetical protein
MMNVDCHWQEYEVAALDPYAGLLWSHGYTPVLLFFLVCWSLSYQMDVE